MQEPIRHHDKRTPITVGRMAVATEYLLGFWWKPGRGHTLSSRGERGAATDGGGQCAQQRVAQRLLLKMSACVADLCG